MSSTQPPHLKAAFSPCPNDLWQFSPLILGLLETSLVFSWDLLPINKLNEEGLKETYDIIKVSAPIAKQMSGSYEELSFGGAWALNSGPKLVKKKTALKVFSGEETILIPGKTTAAYEAARLLYPKANFVECAFDQIPNQVDETKLGVIIHEEGNDLEKYNLEIVVDLGKEWQKTFHKPLALGSLCVKRNLAEFEQIKAALLMSIMNAEKLQEKTIDFIMSKSKSTNKESVFKHIHDYVIIPEK